MAKKKGQRLGDDSDDEAKETPAPEPVKKGGKGKKGKKTVDIEVSDDDVPKEEAVATPAQVEQKQQAKQKKGKKDKKKNKDDWSGDDDAVDVLKPAEIEVAAEPVAAPAAAKGGKKSKKDKRKKVDWSDDEDVPATAPTALELAAQQEEEEEEELPTISQKSKKQKKRNAFDAPEDEMEDLAISAEPVDEPTPVVEDARSEVGVTADDGDEAVDDVTEAGDMKGKKTPKVEKKKKKDLLGDLAAELEDQKVAKQAAADEEMALPGKGKGKKGRAASAKKKSPPPAEEKAEEPQDEQPDDDEFAEENTEVQQRFDHEDEVVESVEIEPDAGVKLSRKEQKKLKLQQAHEDWLEKEAKAGGSIDQFSVSQQDKASRDQAVTNDIIIENFSISARGKQLFVNASLKLTFGRRYGLVGPNGHGKTTLLNHIAKRALAIPPNVDCLLCEQEVAADDTLAVDAVMKADETRTELLAKQAELETRVQAGDLTAIEEQNKVYEELRAINSDAAEGKARRILTGLGFDVKMQNRPTKDFSGGWRMRISLARTLFVEPTLLMLDEPTNHLDLNAVIWLDNYIQGWKKTLLVVSHDQGFLDNVCTDVIHLDQQKLFYYRGNYTMFKKMLKKRRAQQMKDFDKQERNIKELKKAGKSSKQAEVKQKEAFTRKQQKNKTKQGMFAESSADTKTELLQRPREYVVKFNFPNPPPLAPPILGVSSMSFGYENQPPLFKNVDFGMDLNSRVAIAGPNGVGKSTFIKILCGDLKPTTGDTQRNHRLHVGRYDQHSAEQLDITKTAVDYLGIKFNKQEQDCRSHLGKFGLPGHAHKINMRDLSGGQKARVVLAELCWSGPDIIIMDEPTNNLDIESIDALTDAINAYKGGVMIVSHDERLILETSCQLWVIDGQNVAQYPGDFDDYREEILTLLGEEVNNPSVAAAAALEQSSESEDDSDSDD